MIISLLIILHGSTQKNSQQEEEAILLAGNLQKLNKYRQISFGYISDPSQSIYKALDELAKGESDRVIVVPLLLSEGRHAREDIPTLFKYSNTKYPDIELIVTRVIGANMTLVSYILDSIDMVIKSDSISKEDAVVLLVGRGGGDIERERAGIGEVYPHTLFCYLDINKPSLADGIGEAEKLRANLHLSHMIIVPYLLSAATLYDKIVKSAENIPQTKVVGPIKIDKLTQIIENKISEAEKDHENKICYLYPYESCKATKGCPRCLRY